MKLLLALQTRLSSTALIHGSAVQSCPRHRFHMHFYGGVVTCRAGTKVVEYTDRTALEVDQMIKEKQEKNKVLREP